MQDQERMNVFLFSKEATDVSIGGDIITKRDNKERCEVQKEKHQVKYITAETTVSKADRSKRFVNSLEEHNIPETHYETNQIQSISKEINESENGENWTERRGARTQNSDFEVQSTRKENGDQKPTRKKTIHGKISSEVGQINVPVNPETVKKGKTTRHDEKQMNKIELRAVGPEDKVQKKNLNGYDIGDKKKKGNDYCKEEVDCENGADISKDKPYRKRFRSLRHTDRLNNGKDGKKILEKDKSTRLIEKKQTPKGSKNTRNKVTMICDFFLSGTFRFLKERQMNICLLTFFVIILFRGVRATMKPQLALEVHPTSPKKGQNVSIECKVTNDTTKYQDLVFQIIRRCSNHTRFQTICFSRNSADKKKFFVERITPNSYLCKLYGIESADQCDYRCNKGPTQSSIISITIDSETPKPSESKFQYAVGGIGVVLVVVVVCTVICVWKQRNNKYMKAPPGSLQATSQ